MPEEQEEKEDLIFGKNAVLAFLEDSTSEEPPDGRVHGQVKQPHVNKIFIAPLNHIDRRIERIKQLAKAKRIPVVVAERRKLDQMLAGSQAHQGIVAQISAAEFWDIDAFIESLLERNGGRVSAGSLIAVVDGIEDPHNLGAIIRVAESAGLVALILQARRSAGLTGIVAKTSAGALATLPIVRVQNLTRALEKLKDCGFWIAGLDVHEGQTYFDSDLVRPLALVIGSEGKGMGRLVKENCDMLLKIPMLGRVESLNASVAAGIVFYEAIRQVQKSLPKSLAKDLAKPS